MTDDKAREARYTEAIGVVNNSATRHEASRAVMAVADAEVEAATRELRADRDELKAEAEAWRSMRGAIQAESGGMAVPLLMTDIYSLAVRGARAEKAEAERDQLRAAMTALADRWWSEADHGEDERWGRIIARVLRSCADEVHELLGGCCTACKGEGYGYGGEPCWDCRGTRHPHPRAGDDDTARVGAADTQPEGAGGDHHPKCYQRRGVPQELLDDGAPADLCDCKILWMLQGDKAYRAGASCPSKCAELVHPGREHAQWMQEPTPTAGSKVEGSEIPSPETSEAGSSDTAPEGHDLHDVALSGLNAIQRRYGLPETVDFDLPNAEGEHSLPEGVTPEGLARDTEDMLRRLRKSAGTTADAAPESGEGR